MSAANLYSTRLGGAGSRSYGAQVRPVAKTNVRAHLCVPDDQEQHLPDHRPAPMELPLGVPLPRQGEVIYLNSTSAWNVELVVHEWLSPVDLRIEVWITHIGGARHRRDNRAPMTQ